MRIPIGPALGIGLIAAILAATLFDLALVAAHGLKPWLGWMLP
jgi:hypothetical protein